MNTKPSVKLITGLVLAVLLFGGCGDRNETVSTPVPESSAEKWGQVVNGLRCSIKAYKSASQEEIIVSFELHNVGRDIIYLKAREVTALFLDGHIRWESKAQVLWLGSLSFELGAADGQRYVLIREVRNEPTTYVELLPGSSKGAGVMVEYWRCLKSSDDRGTGDASTAEEILARPGEHWLTAFYSNKDKVRGKAGLPEGTSLWTGNLRSNTINLTIVEKQSS